MDKPDAPAALQVDDGVADGMRRFGASEEEIAKQQQERGGGEPVADEAYEVHADVWENWLFFLKVQRQWVFVPVSAGMGVSSQRMSLNWSGIRSLVLLSGVKRSRWECLVDDLLVIEDTVLKAEREALKSNDE